MRYAELLENDVSDDELFGPGAMTLGLTPQQCQAVAQTLVSCRKHFERDPEFEEIQEDDPQEFNDIIRDFNRAIMAFRKNDPFSAVAALSVNPINYDLDDWAYGIIANKTGVKLWDIIDMDDPAQQAAYDRAQKEMRAAHTRYDGIVGESDEPSDDELFGEGLKPMSEVLGFLNEHDYDELIDQGFEFGGYPEHDRAVLDDHLEYKNLSVLTVRFNPDNEDDPLVRVIPRQTNE